MICQVIRPAGGAGRPPQASARKILENVPYSHLGRGVKGGWHQGCARTIPPTHRARVALPSRDSDACAPLKRRASLLFSLTHPPSRDSRTVQDP